jgi:alanine dehydrogenase
MVEEDLLYLSRRDLEPLLTMREVLHHAEEANGLYVKSKAGQNQASFSLMSAFHTKIPNSDIDYRAGTMDPIPTLCSTLGFGYGDNPVNYGISGLFALGVLSRVDNGLPVAVMEAEYLSNMRTGAAAVVAAKHLARPSPRAVAFIGTGNLARHMFHAHVEEYGSIEDARTWSRTPATRERFAAEMQERFGISVKVKSEPRDAVVGADVTYCSTRSRQPVVVDEWVAPGMHISCSGADAPGKQEVDPAVHARAKVVVDSLDQCKIGGDIHKALQQGLFGEDHVHAELGEIVNGSKPGRESDDEITVMDATGLSAMDIVVFYHAYERAKERGMGTRLKW